MRSQPINRRSRRVDYDDYDDQPQRSGAPWWLVTLLVALFVVGIIAALTVPTLLSSLKLRGLGLTPVAPTQVAVPASAPLFTGSGIRAGNTDLRPAPQMTADTNAAKASTEQNMLDVAAQPTPVPPTAAPAVPAPIVVAPAPVGNVDLRAPIEMTANTEAARASSEQNTLDAANQIHAIEQATGQALANQTRLEAEAAADAQAAAAATSQAIAAAATAQAEHDASMASSEQNMLDVYNQPTPLPRP